MATPTPAEYEDDLMRHFSDNPLDEEEPMDMDFHDPMMPASNRSSHGVVGLRKDLDGFHINSGSANVGLHVHANGIINENDTADGDDDGGGDNDSDGNRVSRGNRNDNGNDDGNNDYKDEKKKEEDEDDNKINENVSSSTTLTDTKKNKNILYKINSYLRSQWIYNAPVLIDTMYHLHRYALIYGFCYQAIVPMIISWYTRQIENVHTLHHTIHPNDPSSNPSSSLTLKNINSTTLPSYLIWYTSIWIKDGVNWVIPSFIKIRSLVIQDMLAHEPKQWQDSTLKGISTMIALGGCLLSSIYSWRYFSRRINEWNNRYHEYDNSMDAYLSTVILEQWFLLNNRIYDKQANSDNPSSVNLHNDKIESLIGVSTYLLDEEKIQNGREVMSRPIEHLQEHYHHHSQEINLSRDLKEMIITLDLLKTAERKNSPFITIVDLTCATQHYKVYHSIQKIVNYTVKNIAIARYKHRTCAIVFHTFENESQRQKSNNHNRNHNNNDNNKDDNALRHQYDEEIESHMRKQYEGMERCMLPVLNRHRIWEEDFMGAVCARFLDLKTKDNIWFVMKAHRCAYQNVQTFRVSNCEPLETPLMYHRQIGWDPSLAGRWDLWCINVHFRK